MGTLKAIKTSTLVKRVGTPLYQAAARCVVGLPGPPILANSPPKAGTHVLSSLLSALPLVMFSGRHHQLSQFQDDAGFAWAEVRGGLAKVRSGQFATGHFPAHPRFVELLRDVGMRTVVIFRDPRDMVVSQAFYIRSLTRHPLHELYSGFPTVSEAIDASIAGVEPGPHGRGHPSVEARLASYVPWLESEGILTVRFEDLVGEQGGGSRAAQLKTVAEIARHVERPLTGEQLDRVCTQVFAPSSATFRKGQIGDWKNHLTDRQREAFRERAGEYLVRLGYESGDDW